MGLMWTHREAVKKTYFPLLFNLAAQCDFSTAAVKRILSQPQGFDPPPPLLPTILVSVALYRVILYKIIQRFNV